MESFTKIVATLGPACDTVEGIEKLRKAGLNVARLNFSHGSHDYFRKVIANIRKVDTNIAILLDTKGPEIRTGDYESGSLTLDLHEKILLSNKPMKEKHILIQYPHLLTVSEGTEILIDDGLVEVRVLKVEKDHLVARVENSAVLGSRKTVTIRNHQTKIPFLSQKDKEDIEFGIEQNLDFIAASFVREVEDLEQIEAILKKHNSSIKIISKIEHPRAIENLDKIIEKSFGIMVARGDLGVELPAEKVPEYQSYIIEKCNFFGKPVIVATQMLESMKSEPRPTRAEVADVANAVREGADAVMLSGETANGKHPHKAVQTMNRIAHEYQDKIRVNLRDLMEKTAKKSETSSLYMTKAAYEATLHLPIKAIFAPTESGFTARNISRFRPQCPIYAITSDGGVHRQLQLSWGVFPLMNDSKAKNHDACVNKTVKACSEKKELKNDDSLLVLSGHVSGKSGMTNMLEIYKTEDILKR